jgi:hypothetical protein
MCRTTGHFSVPIQLRSFVIANVWRTLSHMAETLNALTLPPPLPNETGLELQSRSATLVPSEGKTYDYAYTSSNYDRYSCLLNI